MLNLPFNYNTASVVMSHKTNAIADNVSMKGNDVCKIVYLRKLQSTTYVIFIAFSTYTTLRIRFRRTSIAVFI